MQFQKFTIIFNLILLVEQTIILSAHRLNKEQKLHPHHRRHRHQRHEQHLLKRNENNAVSDNSDKKFENVTVKVGQSATLPCFVSDTGFYKVIWSKDGDILTLGSTKINSDPRLLIQHRYVSEWHLIVDSVVTDDEGEYLCKTNVNFIKTIYLHVLMPPNILDEKSTPAGAIAVREASGTVLKCYADAKPDPIIKWYRWRKFQNIISEKEELDFVGNELEILSAKKNDPNFYECIAKNSVPPATSRIFKIEVEFLPTVELQVRKTFQFLKRKFSLECTIVSNPIEKVFWSKNDKIFSARLTNKPVADYEIAENNHLLRSIDQENIVVDKSDISSIGDNFKTLTTLTVANARKEDFGEYQCCASNKFGQTCSNILVKEINDEPKFKSSTKPAITSLKSSNPTISKSDRILKIKTTDSLEQHSLSSHHLNTNTMSYEIANPRSNQLNRTVLVDELNDSGTTNAYDYDENQSSENNKTNSLDSKDKRRHYLIKSKNLLHSDNPSSSSITHVYSLKSTWIFTISLTWICLLIAFIL